MYLLNSTLTVNWYLETGASPPALATLDIKITRPDRTNQYIDSAILAENYVESTANTKGTVAYDFTPDQEGLWEISLVSGSAAGNSIYYTHKIQVNAANTEIQKFVKGSLL